MKKAILISIKPEWVEKILYGDKTIEIRKFMPRCDLPIDVYIYCTKGDINLYKVIRKNYIYFSGAVAEPFDEHIGFSLTKEKLAKKYRNDMDAGFGDIFTNLLNGKIVAKFTLNKSEKFKVEYLPLLQEMGYINPYSLVSFTGNLKTMFLEQKSCLLLEDIYKYAKNKNIYAWYIDNLQIFDKPMELNQFYTYCSETKNVKEHKGSLYINDVYKPLNYSSNPGCRRCKYYDDDFNVCRQPNNVTRPPQSWQYVFVEDENE